MMALVVYAQAATPPSGSKNLTEHLTVGGGEKSQAANLV